MMAEGYYLLRERKQPDLDAPSRTVGLVETAPEAVRWCKNTPDDVSARHFEFVSVINSDEGNSPVSGVAESYVAGPDRNELLRVNTTAAWAMQQMKILADMAEDRDDVPAWVAKEVRRIRDGMETAT